jgi:hypothetical protein
MFSFLSMPLMDQASTRRAVAALGLAVGFVDFDTGVSTLAAT